jgi:hypothetical protein
MFTDDRYLKLESDVNKFKKTYQDKKASGKYSLEYLIKLENEFNEAIRKDLQSYYDDRVQSLRDEQEKIKSEYAKQDSEDPTKELLKRQEWDIELKLSDRNELTDKVNAFIKAGEGDKVYLNMLRLSLRERGLTEEETQLKAYMNAYNLDEPYKNDQQYQNLAMDILGVNQARNSGMLHVGTGENKRVVSLKL